MEWAEFLADRAHHNLYVSSLVYMPTIKLVRRVAKPGEALLEAGCGSGRTAILFSDMGYPVTALDLSKQLVRQLSKTKAFFDDLTPINGDIRHLPFGDKVFKLVYSCGVLEHFDPEDIVPILAEQRRTARYVVVDVPNDRCTQRAFGDERLFSDALWSRLFDRAGLRVLKIVHRGLDRGKAVANCSVFLTSDNRDRVSLEEKIDVYDFY